MGSIKTGKRFFNLNIGRKLLLGYSTLILLTILIAFFALHYLDKLNSINESITQKNIPIINASENMIESVYSQELYGNRYYILKSNKMMELFSNSQIEFKKHLNILNELLTEDIEKVRKIQSIYDEYNTLFREWFLSEIESTSDQKKYDKIIFEKQSQLIAQIQGIYNQANLDQNQKNITLSLIGMKAFRIITIICIISIIIGIGAALRITQSISKPIVLLKNATHEISKGNFDHMPHIKNKDEIGDLAHSFEEMRKRLKNIEEMYLDANPLTRLPGGIAIENVLKKRINSTVPIAFCLVDLDHFKIFNDYYGYVRGNEVIKKTAEIIESASKKFGTKSDFIGHIGGDDFVIITSVKHFERICQFIIDMFDRLIVEFYDKTDLDAGFILEKSRSGIKQKFTIMTISIAVVTNKGKKFKHHIEVGEIAAELKNYAKSLPSSLFIVDRRRKNSKRTKS
ncbi:MAG: diguanylate cyclase [Candidatus Aminicenantes bacterium]|nr:diguanylate cyclase [Candidatus Aminicenantes bacterium]